MAPLNIGVIGCGGIAQMMHLPFIVDHPEMFNLVGICDASPATLDVVGRRFHVPHQCPDPAELVSLPIDAVLVLTSGIHSDQVITALRAGKHVFSEKPLAFSPQEALAVQAEVDRANVTLMVGYMKRYDPAYRQARTLVAGLQDLRFAQINVWHPDDSSYRTHHVVYPPPVAREAPNQSGRAAWVEAAATTGATALRIDEAIGTGTPLELRMAYFLMCDSLIHQVSAMRGILGEPEQVISTVVWRGVQGITSTFRFPRDLLCTLTWVSLPALKRYQEAYVFLSSEARVSLEFPSPYLRHFPTHLSLQGMDGDQPWEKTIVTSYREAFHEELRHFHHCVTSGAAPETGIDEAIRDANTLVAMARAYVPPPSAG